MWNVLLQLHIYVHSSCISRDPVRYMYIWALINWFFWGLVQLDWMDSKYLMLGAFGMQFIRLCLISTAHLLKGWIFIIVLRVQCDSNVWEYSGLECCDKSYIHLDVGPVSLCVKFPFMGIEDRFESFCQPVVIWGYVYHLFLFNCVKPP